MHCIDSLEDKRTANEIRNYFARLTNLPSPEQMIISPGIGLGLHLLFAGRVKNILTHRHAYLANSFAWTGVVSQELPGSIIEAVGSTHADAVILSPVTWLGDALPVADMFAAIRDRYRQNRPLLIADCAHAGAIGFPNLDELGADVVCLDTGKWVLSEEMWVPGATLLWCMDDMFEWARKVFLPFHLAVSGIDQPHLKSSWMRPEILQKIHHDLPDQITLQETLQADRQFAQAVAERLGVTGPESSLFCVTEEASRADLVAELEGHGLVWRLSPDLARIRCRSQIGASVLSTPA